MGPLSLLCLSLALALAPSAGAQPPSPAALTQRLQRALLDKTEPRLPEDAPPPLLRLADRIRSAQMGRDKTDLTGVSMDRTVLELSRELGLSLDRTQQHELLAKYRLITRSESERLLDQYQSIEAQLRAADERTRERLQKRLDAIRARLPWLARSPQDAGPAVAASPNGALAAPEEIRRRILEYRDRPLPGPGGVPVRDIPAPAGTDAPIIQRAARACAIDRRSMECMRLRSEISAEERRAFIEGCKRDIRKECEAARYLPVPVLGTALDFMDVKEACDESRWTACIAGGTIATAGVACNLPASAGSVPLVGAVAVACRRGISAGLRWVGAGARRVLDPALSRQYELLESRLRGRASSAAPTPSARRIDALPTNVVIVPDSNVMAIAARNQPGKTETVLHALGSGRDIHLPPAMRQEAATGVIPASRTAADEELRRILGRRMTNGTHQLQHRHAQLAGVFERPLSRADAEMFASAILSCPRGRQCAFLSFDNGFRQLERELTRGAANRPTALEQRFQSFIASLPAEERARIMLPRIIHLQ